MVKYQNDTFGDFKYALHYFQKECILDNLLPKVFQNVVNYLIS